MNRATIEAEIDTLSARLEALLGPGVVLRDADTLQLVSGDVYSTGAYQAVLCARPTSVDSVAEAVRTITTAGFNITTRGGGMTYTGGYPPAEPATVVVDMSALNRIVEVCEDDLYITVEAGVTWQQIHETLTPMGLRLPFFGTFSGAVATVGGGLSNGAVFMGTARYGGAAEIVLGMEVVTAAGQTIITGQAAFRNGRPFYRTYGPDITGLFVHDGGALGIKTRATLRLMRAPAHLDFASFMFANQLDAVAALSEIGRTEAAEEVYLFDPHTSRRNLSEGDIRTAVKSLGRVVRGSGKGLGGLARGLREGARIVAAGRNFIDADAWSLHLVCAGRSDAAVAHDMAMVKNIAEQAGGVAIADSIPRAVRSAPFGPLNAILGPKGERWVALNAKVAHTDAPRLIGEVNALIAGYEERMQASNVSVSFLSMVMDTLAFSLEPVLHWPDEWLPIHRATPEPSHLKILQEPEPNQEGRALVAEIRQAMVDCFAEFGAASNQIGKTYPYLASLNPQTKQLLTALKQELDPAGKMNPGVLGKFNLANS
jgi:FAD/FMN-containing dehydrogenase